jgi:phosphoribosylformylglycinamidine synthase
MAITNCLNFGNPTRPEVFFQLEEAIAGMGEACRALGTPVTGGNVSLYNESPAGAVYPTPVIGMVGLIEDIAHVTGATFRVDGDAVLLLGEMGDELGGSEYLATIHGAVLGAPPKCDVEREKRTIDVLLEAIRSGAVTSAHDCSDGGIGIALAECCIANPEAESGADIDLTSWAHLPNRILLFGETQGRFIVSSSDPARIEGIARKAGVPCTRIGTVRSTSPDLSISLGDGGLRAGRAMMRNAYHRAIPEIMSRTPQHSAVTDPTTVSGH